MKTVIVLVVVLSIPVFAFAATLYVPDDYPTIQQAIDAATSGDIVLVSPGTYDERIDFSGKAITVRGSGGAEATTINAPLPGSGSVVTFANGEGLDSRLEGFTLTGGWTEYPGGGGICCDHTSPTILNNIISNNGAGWASSNGYGGGVYSSGGSPVIFSNTITQNWVSVYYGGLSHGAGLYLKGGTPIVVANTISENENYTPPGGPASPGQGGGIFASYTNALIAKNLIQDNKAFSGIGICVYGGNVSIKSNIIISNSITWQGGYGGGICLNYCSSLIENNIIAYNHTPNVAGGIRCHNCSPLIVNNVICNNWTGNSGGGINCHSSSPTIANTILWDNSAPTGPEIWIGETSIPSTLTISYSDVKGGQSSVYVDPGCNLNWGPGMIDSDPLFVDPANGDFHLTFLSPCRGSGDNTAVTELYDFEGDPRICQGTVDIGADECYRHLYCMGNFTSGGSIEGKFVGLPGTAPVSLLLGFEVLDPPLPTMWGNFHLKPPFSMIPLVPIPANGVLVLPATIPVSPSAPYRCRMCAS
jgi:hypothetical protein